MFSPLVSLINDIALGPEKRKVKQFLDAATRESVYSELGIVLETQLKSFVERELLRATFDKHAIESSTAWTQECFRNHIRSSYSDAIVSDAAVRLLWRSFYFYARHPFPTPLQQPQDAALDFDSFKRAALLTVFQADSLLGTRELDWYWRESAPFFHRAGIARVLSSLTLPSVSGGPQQNIDVGAFNDAMDVLAMTGPQLINAVPSEDQLEPVVRRLFAEGGRRVVRGQTVKREDLSTLMDLLLRLSLREHRWGSSYPFGNIIEGDCEHGGVTKALVDFLASNDGGENVRVQQLVRMIGLLPNFLLRFQQLWAVLFQPAESANMTKLSVGDIELASVSGAISLFAPYIELDNAGRQQSDRQDTQIILKPSLPATSDSQDAAILDLSRVLSDSAYAHVVLFTTGADTIPKTIIGGYFPAATEKGPHVLFQLQPTLSLLRWTKPKVSLADLITTDAKLLSGEAVGNEAPSSPYWIGDPMALRAGLQIDLEKRTATLAIGKGGCYTDVEMPGREGGAEKREVTIQNARMHVFVVAGAGVNKRG
ncbi:hypothetical protein F4802DRAFT_614977 [Xylaria palmicola]|nr:hypothetical protein F4802DRAFT_614977 [Xylaria palmicola]